jgi:sterol desaturase/sphingolipid hydroxylase (fatty acid hydroxylase superfamily)
MGVKDRLKRFSSFWIFPLLSILLLASSYRSTHSLFNLARYVAAGLVMWTLLEYLFHRFLLHTTFHDERVNAIVNESHLEHHKVPRNPDKILVQAPFALVTSTLLYFSLYAITRDGFETSGIMSGIWLGFLYYEAVHYRVHMSLAHSPILQRQRRAHFYHHFSDSEKCFGVTSSFWDYVFGTRRREIRQT